MWHINGITYKIEDVQKQSTLIDVCSQLGFDVPRFCYHENSKIAGNCRMCSIEDAKSPKPVICCASNLTSDLTIYTNTAQVKKSREAVMEFLLINHPLDCPICDQGGECDSQDLAIVYGSDHGRFYDYKKNVENKNCGPIVKTVMNRCILCTRCVRFASDVAGFNALGLTGRGGKMEIGSYVEKFINTELSGNVVDICPVGALTSKPYAFTSRPWELKSVNFINILDDLPQILRADIKENEIVRVLPSKNVYEASWITNRTRFSHESLVAAGRVVEPFVFGRKTTWGTLLFTLASWIKVSFNQFSNGKSLLLGTKLFFFTGLSGIILDIKTSVWLKSFVSALGSSSSSEIKHLSLTFLPRGNGGDLFNRGITQLNVLNIDMQFELPLMSVALTRRLSSATQAITLVNWKSALTSLLNIYAVVLNTGICDLLEFASNKTWVASINERSGILSVCKINIFNMLFFKKRDSTFLVSKTASGRSILNLDFSSFSETSKFQYINYFEVSTNNYVDVLNNNSLISLKHEMYVKYFKNITFLTPAQSLFEGVRNYFNDNYSSLKVDSILPGIPTLKSLVALLSVLSQQLSLGVKLNAFTNSLAGQTKLAFFHELKVLLQSYFQLKKFKVMKSASQLQYYSEHSLTYHSETLFASLMINTNIYY